jgi:stage V sporulation protein D (sporulation-specific penicillin-binding protein)
VDNPQIAIYVVVDRPNVEEQDTARYACVLAKDILQEALPYLHIYMTEDLSDREKQELEEKGLRDTNGLGD